MAHPTSALAAVDSKSKSTIRANINSILPPELLALAFSFPVNDAIDAISFNAFGGPDQVEVQRRFGQHPLWNATLVCREWYTIIKDTPSFWTFVALGFSAPVGSSAGANDPSAAATSRSPCREERIRGIETLLERSGRLPLTVVLCPENIQDLLSISQALHKHFDRLEVISLVASDNLEPHRRGRGQTPSRITLDQALGLLAGPIPKLKLLSVSTFLVPLMHRIAGRSSSVHREVDTPELETISCYTHLITPSSPNRLFSLSLIDVNLNQPEQRSIELPHLVELRIENCDPGTILSTLVIPSLRRLVVEYWRSYHHPAQLPRYDSLQELQWEDSGWKDPVFVMLSRLCPNLKRYLNYIEEDITEEDIEMADQSVPDEGRRPMILTAFDEDVLGGLNTYRHWPLLEEVSLDLAACDHLATLIMAVPSIKRVRVLRDPVLSRDEDDQEEERDKLAVLRGKVEIAIRAEPWGSKSWRNEMAREAAASL